MTYTYRGTSGNGHLSLWTLASDDDTGQALSQLGASDRTVHVYGDFSGGVVVLEGSNDPDQAAWNTLHDTTGALLSFSTSGIAVVAESPLFIRPRLSGGATPAVSVSLATRSAR